MKIRLVLSLAVLACGTLPASAHAEAATGIQAALDRVVTDGVPGGILLSARHQVTSGVRDLRTGTKVGADDRFRIGSNTKTFVSTVVLQLVGEGRLRLTDRVERWLPGLLPDGKAITVRQLLNHTSGLPDYGADPRLLAPYQRNPAYYWAPNKLVGLVRTSPRSTGFAYSNTNYIVLGLIIEKVTGLSASTEIQRRLLQPLKLPNSSFPLRDPHIHGPHLHGYLTGNGHLDVSVLSPSVSWTAGGMISTVGDLARFQRALFTGKLLRKAQLKQLETIVPGEDYGLGVVRLETPCGTAWGHEGSFPGYFSAALTSLDGKRRAMIAINSDRVLSDQTWTDVGTAMDTAFCDGQPTPGGNTTRVFTGER